MDRPLGFACGNALEVKESIDALRGEGPDDLMEVTYALGAEMLILAGVAPDATAAWRRMRDAVTSGRALEKFVQIIEAQGGDARIVDDDDILPSAPKRAEFVSSRDGVVLEVAPRSVGHGVIALRGGRRTMEDKIEPSVGFTITAKPGDTVVRGQTLATIHALDDAGLREGNRALADAIRIGDGNAEALPLVSHKITADGVVRWSSPEA
jgi:pyrimidine-nucleoside phosphorylase